jgi:prepilin-type N-terminal cleavage/methylation domain-containing protein
VISDSLQNCPGTSGAYKKTDILPPAMINKSVPANMVVRCPREHHRVVFTLLDCAAKKQRGDAFTLVEVMIALVLLGLVAASTFWAYYQVNTQAVAARLFTNATAIAQNQLELFETDGPFNPQLSQVPLSLVIDWQQKSGIVIYTDPENDNVIVTGTLTTQVTDPGFTLNSVNLNMRQVTVTLSYTYRGWNYYVTMSGLRTSDI